MKELAYPFLDRRSLCVLLATVGLNLAYLVFVLCWIGLMVWIGAHHRITPPGEMPSGVGVGFAVLIAFHLCLLLGGIFYVGALVATNREGWKRTGRLPELRWRETLVEGLKAGFFTGLSLVLPYFALYLALMGMAVTVFGMAELLKGIHQNLGLAAGVLGVGGLGLALVTGLFLFILGAWTVVPLLQARYAATGQLSSYFRLIWALQTIMKAPGKFLLYQLPTLVFFSLGALLHFATFGVATMFLMFLFPFVQLNQAYLMGHFYGEFVDPTRGDLVPA